jgi:pimeloyl-ACP methyl ester carboxylesterase
MAVPIPELPGVEHSFVEAGGVRFHVASAGSGDPVVLIHGWPQHWWAWREVIPALAQTNRVIAPDLRGLGWSDAPRDGYEKEQFARDMLGVLDELGVERFRLIGHDWGAFAGFLMCLRAPERVERYIACSIPPLWPPAERPSPIDVFKRLSYQIPIATPLVGKLAIRSGKVIRKALTLARRHGSYTEEELAMFADVNGAPDRAHSSVAIYRTFLLKELKPLATGAYRSERLTTPTRLLAGDGDPIFDGKEPTGYEEYADDMTFIWVPGAGHWLPDERPDFIVEQAREFLLA